ncbi:MAG: hypothetical protein GY950_31135, partial [bacterium]|nr:hypothetical protein [bacterium]
MNSYLSRIANRARGINKANSIEPVLHSWPTRRTTDNSNPFEGETGPESVNPAENTIPPAHATHTAHTTHTTQTLPEPVIVEQDDLKHTPLHRHKQKNVQKQINIAPVKPAVAKPVLKKTGDETPINPVSTTKRIIHNPVSGPTINPVFTQRIESMDNKRSLKEPVPREPDKPAVETVRQSTVEPAVSDLSPTGSKNSQPITAGVHVPVPELRPVSANAGNPAIVTPLKKENKGPRLVIGRIKVEVVTPQPVKNQP